MHIFVKEILNTCISNVRHIYAKVLRENLAPRAVHQIIYRCSRRTFKKLTCMLTNKVYVHANFSERKKKKENQSALDFLFKI